MILGFALYAAALVVFIGSVAIDLFYRFMGTEDGEEPKHPHPFWFMFAAVLFFSGLMCHVFEFAS